MLVDGDTVNDAGMKVSICDRTKLSRLVISLAPLYGTPVVLPA